MFDSLDDGFCGLNTSGEIPIYLNDGSSSMESLLCPTSPHLLDDLDEDIGFGGMTSSRSMLSTMTVDTIGTFGPIHCPSQRRTPSPLLLAACSPSSPVLGYYEGSRDVVHSRFTISAYLEPEPTTPSSTGSTPSPSPTAPYFERALSSSSTSTTLKDEAQLPFIKNTSRVSRRPQLPRAIPYSPPPSVAESEVFCAPYLKAVEILVDQEQWRSIVVQLRLSGISSDNSIASFVPVKRQTAVFHYDAPFESSPILRRIMSGDDTHDYITRQASLTVKTSGVYTVQGTETVGYGHGTGVEARLQWNFDYAVEERSGKGNDGERILTPLSFSCTPALLDPTRRKKIRLMHVMRKSVVPKLIAHKVEAPLPPCATKPPPSNSILKSPFNASHYISKSYIWTHRRATSHAHSKDTNDEVVIGKNANLKVDENRPPPSTPLRRRRASSAGEREVAREKEDTRARASESLMQAAFIPQKNILRRSQLKELMAETEERPPTPTHDPKSLSPRPRAVVQS